AGVRYSPFPGGRLAVRVIVAPHATPETEIIPPMTRHSKRRIVLPSLFGLRKYSSLLLLALLIRPRGRGRGHDAADSQIAYDIAVNLIVVYNQMKKSVAHRGGRDSILIRHVLQSLRAVSK